MKPSITFDVIDTDDHRAWKEIYSDWGRYAPEDLFLNNIVSRFSDNEFRTSRDWLDCLFYSILLAIFLTVILLQLNYRFAFLPAPLLDFLYPLLVALGWVQHAFGGPFLFTFAIISFAALLYEFAKSRNSASKAKKLWNLLQEISTSQQLLYQIYPGGGSLRFSYGNNGVLVDGTNTRTHIAWHALKEYSLLHVEYDTVYVGGNKKEEKRKYIREFKTVSQSEEATHLRLVFKLDGFRGTPDLEFLIIPRNQFFPYERNSMRFQEFVAGIEKNLKKTSNNRRD